MGHNSKNIGLKKFTRGNGLLEGFLTRWRARKANELILEKHREGRILDIGCGSYPFFLISTKFKKKHGIDPSLNLLSLNTSSIYLKNIKIDDGKIPFKDNFFNAVTMLAVFEHIDRKKVASVVKEIVRILDKDGTLILTTPAPWSNPLLRLMSKLRLVSKEEMEEHKHSHSRQEIEDILKEAGFKRNKINSGFFEFYFNMWFRAEK